MKIKVLLLFLYFVCCWGNVFAQGVWTQKSSFPGAARFGAVGFSIGCKGYIGTGASSPFNNYLTDFWEWDQATNLWTQKTDFGGAGRYTAVGFSIGDKGYIGTGDTAGTNDYSNDFWEWDKTSNVWTQKADFGGTPRYGAVGFSIGTKGYIGLSGGNYNDFWEWNQTTNSWSQKTNFSGAGTERLGAACFSIGTKGYIGTGTDSVWPLGRKDFWEWDQATNFWTQKADFGGIGREEAIGFSIGNYGYIGTGTTSIGSGTVADFWKYNPSSNTWIQVANFGAGLRELAVSFSIGCKAYVGTGWINDGTPKNDFWEYYDSTNTTCIVLSTVISSQNSLCNGPCVGTAIAIPTGGICSYIFNWSNGQTTQTLTGLCAGAYIVTVTDAAGNTTTATVTITQPPVLTGTTSQINIFCSGDINGTATVAVTGGVSPYSYLWNTGVQTQSIASLQAGTYIVTVTDSNGCTAIDTSIVSQPSPLSLTISGDTTISRGQASALTASASGGTPAYAYAWNADSAGGSAITVNPSVTSVYCVKVHDANNCIDSSCITVNVESPCGDVFVATIFSPNGDGQNDVLFVRGKCIKELSFIVYDRWGEKIFETTELSKGWDGTFNGQAINAAVFVYTLIAVRDNGDVYTEQGNVTLVR